MRILVAGAGGFIGGHLVGRLLAQGHQVVAADIKRLGSWWQIHPAAGNLSMHDLRLRPVCDLAVTGCQRVYNLACDMGGIGFIETHKAQCMRSVLINTHLLEAAREAGVRRYFYSSSACVYAAGVQDRPDAPALKETDAYPAMPEDGYGWEKLFSERMCRHYAEDYCLDTRSARFHNVYGPHGSWCDGREKAPAALCRKVAESKLYGEESIELWGDGTRTRSYMWIGDCLEGIQRIMAADDWPAQLRTDCLNLGSAEQVSVDDLLSAVADVADHHSFLRLYDRSKPQGVQGRNSDNTLIRGLFGWEPSTPLSDGLAQTYPWIEEQVKAVGSA